MARLVSVLGSVTPPGRLHRAVSAALESVQQSFPRWEIDLIDLADYRLGFADGRPLDQLKDDTPAVIGRIVSADAIVLATPVYRTSFTGALKNLLDLIPVEGLAGKPCGIIAMGATPHHYLGVDSQLRAALAWFGALVAPNSVYLMPSDFFEGQPSPAARDEVTELMRSVLTLQIALRGLSHPLGPRPLAARQT
ncbi:MAG TPA: NAD(P)H-dependent oxidoreductase [Dehalococcoidia bacterium]|nr:NAD(P)H-dependent oxidoreductase [Dehalococcoidia bacterium]